MYGILGGQVRHPPKLFKRRQVFELGLDKIRYLDGAYLSYLVPRK